MSSRDDTVTQHSVCHLGNVKCQQWSDYSCHCGRLQWHAGPLSELSKKWHRAARLCRGTVLPSLLRQWRLSLVTSHIRIDCQAKLPQSWLGLDVVRSQGTSERRHPRAEIAVISPHSERRKLMSNVSELMITQCSVQWEQQWTEHMHCDMPDTQLIGVERSASYCSACCHRCQNRKTDDRGECCDGVECSQNTQGQENGRLSIARRRNNFVDDLQHLRFSRMSSSICTLKVAKIFLDTT